MKTRETVKNNDRHHPQPVWQRIALLIILGYEAAGALTGGFLLSLAPDGRWMDMPVEIMHGFFRDFFLPGTMLIGLGILNTLAFISVLNRNRLNGYLSALALGGLAIWFFVEILILREFHWLHAMWGLPVILGCLLIIPALPFSRETWRKISLCCGIGSSLLYVGMNILIPLGWEGYDPSSQVVSELSAVNAPTRFTWTLFCIPYTLLMVAFGWGGFEISSSKKVFEDNRMVVADF